MNSKGNINNPVDYLPKLTEKINTKIDFWRTDLGSNILAQNTPDGGNSRRCFAMSTTEADLNSGNESRKHFGKNRNNRYRYNS